MNPPDVDITDGMQRPIAEPLTAIIDRARKAQEKRQERMEKILADAPQHQTCPVCETPGAELDRDASLISGTPRYSCHRCLMVAADMKWKRKLTAAGIPSDVHHASLENFIPGAPNPNSDDPHKFVEHARSFLAAKFRNLILAGPPGVGKGHLAAAIAIEHLRRDLRVRWRVIHRLFEAGHRAYEDGTREDLIQGHVRVDLLVLDEIAMGEMPRDGERTLYDIVDGRHKEGRPTILLSNQAAEPIKNWMGPAITDRLRSGGVRFLWADWESARGNRTKDHAF